MVLWTKLWFYGQNYGTIIKTMVLYRDLWNFDLRRKKHDRLPKTKKLWFIMDKKLWQYTKTIEVFEQIYSFPALIYYEKLSYYGRNYGTMGKIWYHGKNYGTMKKN